MSRKSFYATMSFIALGILLESLWFNPHVMKYLPPSLFYVWYLPCTFAYCNFDHAPTNNHVMIGFYVPILAAFCFSVFITRTSPIDRKPSE
jgi:hypothetical protein